MRYLKKILSSTCVAVALFANTGAFAQEPAANTFYYKTAYGLRGGGTSGLTIKHFINSSTALEGIVGIWPYTISLTGLYETYANAGAEGLSWYYGGGGHITFESGTYHERDYYYRRDHYRAEGLGLGIDGVLGLEYKIRQIPFAISFDIKPMIEVNVNGGNFFALDPGLGVKFAF